MIVMVIRSRRLIQQIQHIRRVAARPAGLVTDCNRRPASQAYVLVHAVPKGWLRII